MLSELKKKEIASVKEMLDAFTKSISETEQNISLIDEKYKKLAEEEKKNLKSELSEFKSQKKIWEKMFNGFDATLVEEALGVKYESTSTVEPEEVVEEPVETTTEEVVEEEEKVVDKLFPENNEEEKVEEKEEPFVNEELQHQAEENLNEIWPEDTTTVDNGEMPVDSEEEDPWPTEPEEWKD